ncbi:MAG: YggT family protein [Nitrospirae bacterium]|nr:YggT family protein [Nitrospirota bacterium]
MFLIANLLLALARISDILLTVYMWIIIISALISWVNPDPYNPIVKFLRSITEPVLRLVRRRLGISMGIDFSPMVIILIILFIKYFLINSLIEFAYKLKGGIAL